MQNKSNNSQIQIQTLYVNTGRSVKLTVPRNETLDSVLTKSYTELGETRQETDNFFCENGTSLKSELNKPITSVISGKCKGSLIEIRGRTGGA